MGEVSKFVGGQERNALGASGLGEFDSVKKVSILIDARAAGRKTEWVTTEIPENTEGEGRDFTAANVRASNRRFVPKNLIE
jgi:hypothetical protein